MSPTDIPQLVPEESQDWMVAQLGVIEGGMRAAIAAGLCETAVLHGAPIAAGGVLPLMQGRAAAWIFFGRVPKWCWVPLVRRMRAICGRAERKNIHRIEAHVVRGFDAGGRLARAVGFRSEGVRRAWFPDMTDAIEYVRVAPWAQPPEASVFGVAPEEAA